MTCPPSPQDRSNLARAAEILAESAGSADLPYRAFAALAAVVEADLLTFNDVNLDTGEARFVLSPARPPDVPFLRRFGYHPAATGLAAAQGADSSLVPRFVSDPRLRALGVGNCCGDADMKLNSGLPLSEKPGRLVGISISRAVRDFDECDRALLAVLQPLIVDAFRRAFALPERRPAAKPSPAPTGSERLTRREREVLYWVAMGKTNEEIATIIGARPLTVKKHLEHVYQKLEVPNRTAAAMAAQGVAGGAMQLVVPPVGAT